VPYPLDPFAMAGVSQSPDRDVRFRDVVSAVELADATDDLILKVAQPIMWTFGATRTAELIQRCFAEIRRPPRQRP